MQTGSDFSVLQFCTTAIPQTRVRLDPLLSSPFQEGGTRSWELTQHRRPVTAAGSLPLKGGGQEGVLLDGVRGHWISAFAGNA